VVSKPTTRRKRTPPEEQLPKLINLRVVLQGESSFSGFFIWRKRTATHCNTLQHTATHCNTLFLWVLDVETTQKRTPPGEEPRGGFF